MSSPEELTFVVGRWLRPVVVVLDLVRRLLLKAAQDNPRVLKDPAPLVYFLNFGNSG